MADQHKRDSHAKKEFNRVCGCPAMDNLKKVGVCLYHFHGVVSLFAVSMILI
jgi:hypothetical protein